MSRNQFGQVSLASAKTVDKSHSSIESAEFRSNRRVNVYDHCSLTHWQVTDMLLTGVHSVTNCWLTVSQHFGLNHNENCWPIVGQLSGNCWPTEKCLENVRKQLSGRWKTFRESLGIFEKSSKKSSLLCLYNKQNNTWLLVDMEFLFSCLTWYLTSEHSERMR